MLIPISQRRSARASRCRTDDDAAASGECRPVAIGIWGRLQRGSRFRHSLRDAAEQDLANSAEAADILVHMSSRRPVKLS